MFDDEGFDEDMVDSIGMAAMSALQELQLKGWHLHDNGITPHPDIRDGVLIRLEGPSAAVSIPLDIQKVVDRAGGYLSPRGLTDEIKHVLQEFGIR